MPTVVLGGNPTRALAAAMVALAMTGCFTPADPPPTLAPAPPFTMGRELSISGEVIENYREGFQLMSSVHLRLRLPGGREAKVIYGTGHVPCLNQAAQAAGAAQEVGEEIDAYGIAVSNDTLSTCPSGAYYIRSRKTGLLRTQTPENGAVP